MANPFDLIYRRCKSEPLSEYPVLLLADVELTNCCNLQCTMCPTGLGKLMRPKGFMGVSFFRGKILGPLEEAGCKAIRFVRWGEPTLHPQFTEFLKLAKKQGFLVHFNTNGQLFDEELVWAILAYGVDSVKFSFQGTNKDEYERIRRGGKFDTIKKWIKYLYDKRGKGRLPYISVDTTTTRNTDESSESFRKEFGAFAGVVSIGKTSTLVSDGFIRARRNRTCYEYNKLSVCWDGNVNFCCSDFDNLLLCGDLKKDSLTDIWRGEAAVNYRRMIMNGQGKLLPLCKYCLE